MFHKHNFKEKDNILWCECGKVKYLPCCHKWEIYYKGVVLVFGNEQVKHTLICDKCGKIVTKNITTGELIEE